MPWRLKTHAAGPLHPPNLCWRGQEQSIQSVAAHSTPAGRYWEPVGRSPADSHRWSPPLKPAAAVAAPKPNAPSEKEEMKQGEVWVTGTAEWARVTAERAAAAAAAAWPDGPAAIRAASLQCRCRPSAPRIVAVSFLPPLHYCFAVAWSPRARWECWTRRRTQRPGGQRRRRLHRQRTHSHPPPPAGPKTDAEHAHAPAERQGWRRRNAAVAAAGEENSTDDTV